MQQQQQQDYVYQNWDDYVDDYSNKEDTEQLNVVVAVVVVVEDIRRGCKGVWDRRRVSRRGVLMDRMGGRVVVRERVSGRLQG